MTGQLEREKERRKRQRQTEEKRDIGITKKGILDFFLRTSEIKRFQYDQAEPGHQ